VRLPAVYATRPHGFAYMCWIVSWPTSNLRFSSNGTPARRGCRISSAYGPGAYSDSKRPWFANGSLRYWSSASRKVGTHLRRSVSVVVRYGPTTSMSGAAVAIEKACDTTRIDGGNADGDPVGIGSGVRTSVVAVGSTVCTAE